MEFRWIQISLFLTALLHFTVTETKRDEDRVTLRCFVRTYEQFTLKVKWVLEGHNSLQCEVSVNNNKQSFPFKLQSSGDKPGKDNNRAKTKSATASSTSSTQKTSRTTTEAPTTCNASDGWLWLYITVPVVLLAALLIIIVIIITWKRKKGNKTVTNDNAVDPEEGVAYASINFTKKSNGQAQVVGKGDDNEDGVVTYSTVKASTPPSAAAAVGASVDPNSLYATVNKVKN
ncbi:uncharacterized protein LOC141801626 [Halichoeres trimaculatus]|uniref:uncharacterized protein LOC141801626 n=1 Tax=Halichoeres trimaculatus TaxID=147232 RepID=UPI003D9F2900